MRLAVWSDEARGEKWILREEVGLGGETLSIVVTAGALRIRRGDGLSGLGVGKSGTSTRPEADIVRHMFRIESS